jgi:hypothetical protein
MLSGCASCEQHDGSIGDSPGKARALGFTHEYVGLATAFYEGDLFTRVHPIRFFEHGKNLAYDHDGRLLLLRRRGWPGKLWPRSFADVVSSWRA